MIIFVSVFETVAMDSVSLSLSVPTTILVYQQSLDYGCLYIKHLYVLVSLEYVTGLQIGNDNVAFQRRLQSGRFRKETLYDNEN